MIGSPGRAVRLFVMFAFGLWLVVSLACAGGPSAPAPVDPGEPVEAPPTAGSGGESPGEEQPDNGETSGEATPTPGVVEQPTLLENRRLVLEWSPRVRLGESGEVQITLEMDDQGNITPTVAMEGNEVRIEPVQVQNLYETHTILAEARLDMAGAEVSPPGETLEPLAPGQKVFFRWTVRPPEVGTYLGTVWLHLRYIPKDGAAGEEMRRAITAQRVEIDVRNFFGIGGPTARFVGGAGALVGSFLSLDTLFGWGKSLYVRRKRKQGGK